MRSLDVTLPWGGDINKQELERFLGDTLSPHPVGMIYLNSGTYGQWKCFGTKLICAVLDLMGVGLPRGVCWCFVLLWLSCGGMAALYMFLYGLLQNWSLVKLLK